MTFQVIAVDKLTPHPKHVRPNGEPSQRLLASVAARGVEEALDVVPNPHEDGSFWIVEGRRRWLAACKTGRPEVRCVVQWDLDEASQHLLQYLANDSETRLNHNERQQTLALTFAIGAGATRKEVRSQLGLKAKEVQQHIHAGRLSDSGYQRATQAIDGYQPSILEQAILAEFEDDEAATEQLLRGRQYGQPMEAIAENIRQVRADEAEHERLLAAFAIADVPVTDDLPDGAVELDKLRVHDEREDGEYSEVDGESDEEGDFLDSELHSKCPGRGVHFPYDLTEPVEYCTNPVQYGHGFVNARVGQRMRMRAELVEAGETVTENLPPGGWRVEHLQDKDGQELTAENHRQCPGARVFVAAFGPPGAVYYCISPEQYGHRSRTGRAARTGGSETKYVPPRDLVVRANREWLTAAKARRAFLAQLLRRRTAPTGTMAFLAGQLLVMPGPVRTGLGNWRSESLFREFTGKSMSEAKEEAERATTGRLHTLVLAELVAAMEYEIAGDGDRRSTWRTDRANPYCTRDEASAYLKFLKDKAGHKPTAIEKAVILKVRYTGTDPDQEAVDDGTAPAAAEDGSALRAVETGTGQDAATDGAAESAAAAANEHAGQPDDGEGDGDSRPHDTPAKISHEGPDEAPDEAPGETGDGGAAAEAA